MSLTPEEIERLRQLQQRVGEIDALMEKLRHGPNAAGISEYLNLNKERELLDKLLKKNGQPPATH